MNKSTKKLKLGSISVSSFVTEGMDLKTQTLAVKGGQYSANQVAGCLTGAQGGKICNTQLCQTVEEACTNNIGCESLAGGFYDCLAPPTEGAPTTGAGGQ